MTIQSTGDLVALRRVGSLVADTLRVLRDAVQPGITTEELDAIGERFARGRGARSAPQDVYGFPGFNLISVNDQIVHGVPGPRVLQPRDVVKLDVTLELDGYIADAARTVIVPPSLPEARQLQRCARVAFTRAFELVRVGCEIRQLGGAIDREVRRAGFSVVRELSGHGVGRTIHEPPNIPNFSDRGAFGRLTDGLVFTIEPLIAAKSARSVEAADGWTLCTNDGSLSAHHENTVVVTRSGGAEILTAS